MLLSHADQRCGLEHKPKLIFLQRCMTDSAFAEVLRGACVAGICRRASRVGLLILRSVAVPPSPWELGLGTRAIGRLTV